MTDLRLTTAKEPIPVEGLKPRQEEQELAKKLIKLADELVAQVKAKKKDLMWPLDNLPAGVRPKAVQTKMYAMKDEGKLPDKIFPSLRTFKERDKDGKVIKVEEKIYMRYGEPGKTMKKGA